MSQTTAAQPPGGIPACIIAEAIQWRHHLHRHPELAYNERQTADFIAERLEHFGLTVQRGLAGTGLVGTLSRGTSRRTIAIRADMDALPIQERSGVPHASCNAGVMHACGHDGHVAMALAAARVCARLPDLDGTVHFIFQPAEEGGAGARRMIAEGLFERFPSNAVYAIHNWPALPLGTCVALDGAMMAANAVFEITVAGRGCHGAMPHEGTDSILAACHLVCALQSIVSRNIDPREACVVSVTQIHAGHAHNVIPDTCVIRGAARWFDDQVGRSLEQRITQLSNSLVAGFGCIARIHYERRYPATVNDPAAASFVRRVVRESALDLTLVDAGPSMASEDFSFMLQAIRGCYIWLGSGQAGNDRGLHSPGYDFNDELIARGTALWVSLVSRSLAAI
jgi:amidohydrolase